MVALRANPKPALSRALFETVADIPTFPKYLVDAVYSGEND